MIAKLQGSISHKDRRTLILTVGAVGFKVSVTSDFLNKNSLGREVSLWTHLAVREDSLDLYGFAKREELQFFELLLTVSGIGPKSALAIINTVGLEMMRKAVAQNEAAYLIKVSGIGRKTAERIIIELRDKIGDLGTAVESSSVRDEIDVIEALKAIGYSAGDAREAMKKVSDKVSGTSERVKAALKLLGK